jgi:hypothetical protein
VFRFKKLHLINMEHKSKTVTVNTILTQTEIKIMQFCAYPYSGPRCPSTSVLIISGYIIWILDISVLTWTVGTELDISVLSTGQFGTWMRQFGTDHNCLVLINCQYFCTSNSLIYDPKVDEYAFLICLQVVCLATKQQIQSLVRHNGIWTTISRFVGEHTNHVL